MNIKALVPWLGAILLSGPVTAFAQLAPADIFTDHMVLQREKPITVWGTAPAGGEVSVSLGKERASAKADGTGHWQVELPALPASGPFELAITSAGESKSFTDIMLGDVWVISGQSNVVLALQATTKWAEAKTEGVFPTIRICKLPGTHAFQPVEVSSRPPRWEILNSAKAGYFSGVGYYFARTVQPAIGVTLGLVQASAGGTQAEQWTPEADLRAALPDNPLLADREKAMAQAAANPAAKIGATMAGAAVMYNGTVHPLRHLKLAGVLWYQGEANTRSKRDYAPVLKTLVTSWRGVFDQPDLPWIIVQLPNFGLPKDDGWMRVRESQRLIAKELGLPLVITIDQGSATTIHPPNKDEVGRRTALAALQSVYKQDVEGTAPQFKSAQAAQGGVVVDFDGFKGDLVQKGDALPGFELAGADGAFHPAEARVQGRSVLVKSAEVSAPKEVRYLWATSPEVVALYSASGLPAGPFRSGL